MRSSKRKEKKSVIAATRILTSYKDAADKGTASYITGDKAVTTVRELIEEAPGIIKVLDFFTNETYVPSIELLSKEFGAVSIFAKFKLLEACDTDKGASFCLSIQGHKLLEGYMQIRYMRTDTEK